MQEKVKKRRKARLLLAIIAIVVVILIFSSALGAIYKKVFYPIKFEEYVTEFADKYEMDRYFFYSVIKTESNFDPEAVSNVGATGLMQLMPDAFDWVKYRMGDDRELTFEDMENPKYNIEYGGYMLMLLLNEYNDEATALAAYHAGRQSVSNWLEDSECSSDGLTLKKIPSKATAHYVDKVINRYEGYTNLYNRK